MNGGIITVKRSGAGWVACFMAHPEGRRIKEAFGTYTLPLPLSEVATPEQAHAHLAERFPGANILTTWRVY